MIAMQLMCMEHVLPEHRSPKIKKTDGQSLNSSKMSNKSLPLPLPIEVKVPNNFRFRKSVQSNN